MRFEGKTVIVTGSGNGIGAGYAKAFAEEGASVAVVDVDSSAAERTAKEIEASGGRAVGIGADVADAEAVDAAVEATVAEFGAVGILVNNAGLHLGDYNLTTALPNDSWRRIFEVNVLGALNFARACRPSMAAQGGGVILNQSSMAPYHFGSGAYGVSKLALNGLTNALAFDLSEDHIRVVGIAPGMIGSPALRGGLDPKIQARIVDAQLVKRFGEVDDLCGMVLFLCSDAAAFISGQTFLVDGGRTPRT